MKRALSVLIICAALAASGCGYRFGTLPDQDRDRPWRVHVPIFSNKTMESRLEVMMTNGLRHELSLRSGFELAERAEADLIIRGSVLGCAVSPLAFSEGFLAVKYRVELVVRVEVVRVETGEIVWLSDALRDSDEYYSHEDVLIADENKIEAFHRIVDHLAHSICEMIWF